LLSAIAVSHFACKFSPCVRQRKLWQLFVQNTIVVFW
jgi:hypothetical protein